MNLLLRTLDRCINGRPAAAAGLLLAGLWVSRRIWLDFPLGPEELRLSLPVPANPGGEGIPVTLLFLALVSVCVVLGLWRRVVGGVVAVIGVISLLLLPVYLAFTRVDLLTAYVEASRSRLAVEKLFDGLLGWGVGADATFQPVTGFGSMTEQLSAGFAMLGSGWYLALATLLIALRFNWPGSPASLAVFGRFSAWTVAAGALAALLLTPWSALYSRAEGDQALIQGDALGALNGYRWALEGNPALGVSEPFLSHVALALNQVDPSLNTPAVVSEFVVHRGPGSGRFAGRNDDWGEEWTWFAGPLEALERELVARRWRDKALAAAKKDRWLAAQAAFREALNYRPVLENRVGLALSSFIAGDLDQGLPLALDDIYTIAHKPLRARMLCAVGDGYTRAGRLLAAREYYMACRNEEKQGNLVATRALSGV